MEDNPINKKVLEVREIQRQRWLARKKIKERNEVVEKEEYKKKVFRMYLQGKYSRLLELNKVKRSGSRIVNYTKRHFLQECQNDITKINSLYLIRIKFTNQHLNKPNTESKKSSFGTPQLVKDELKKEEERLMDEAIKESMVGFEDIPKELIYGDTISDYIDHELDPELYLAMLESQGETVDKEVSETEQFSFYLGFDLNEIIKNPYQVIECMGKKLYLQEDDINRVKLNYDKVNILTAQGERFIQDLRYHKSYIADCKRLEINKFQNI